MFVPSLSWRDRRFPQGNAEKGRFLTGFEVDEVDQRCEQLA
jgi:hypothetical protein